MNKAASETLALELVCSRKGKVAITPTTAKNICENTNIGEDLITFNSLLLKKINYISKRE